MLYLYNNDCLSEDDYNSHEDDENDNEKIQETDGDFIRETNNQIYDNAEIENPY